MLPFEQYVELIKAQLYFMQPVQSIEAVQLDERWLRQQYEEISQQPPVSRKNELIVAQEWEAERKRRQEEESAAARA